MSKDKYVKLVAKHREDMPDTFCPINIEKNEIIVGLSLIGFCDGKVVGEYNEDTNKLTLYGANKKKEKKIAELSRTFDKNEE